MEAAMRKPAIEIRREGSVYHLEVAQWLPYSQAEVFEFFSEARNLQRLTPAFLRFSIVSSPSRMHEGAEISYRIRVRGVPLRWTSCITRWDPPHCFVDEQTRGPYAVWRHTHAFTAREGGTMVDDQVEFRSRGGVLAPLLHALIVNLDVRSIFEYRSAALHTYFPRGERLAQHP